MNTEASICVTEAEMQALGEQFAAVLKAHPSLPSCTVHLLGTLGAGKTTFARAVLRGLGHKGAVKSPTYTLVEPYEDLSPKVFHFDLYRLGDPEELEYMGIREYILDNSLSLIEWPVKGEGVLPTADLCIELNIKHAEATSEKTQSQESRELRISAQSELGEYLLNQWFI